MDLKTFLCATKNVHKAKHKTEFIFIGNDVVPERWFAFFDGKEKELESVSTLEEAKVAAHRLFDSKTKCSLKLEWELLPETSTLVAELDAPDLI